MYTEYYDIEPKEFVVEGRLELANGDYQYVLSPAEREWFCPICGSQSVIKHGIAKREVRDTSTHGHRVGLLINANRFRCKECKATFTNDFKSIDKDAKITNRLRDYIRQESLKRPFLNIADELGISDTTVRGVFKEYIKELDTNRVIKVPRILGIDENHICNSYRAVFVDIEEKAIIEMLPRRNKSDIIRFIKSLPDYHKIECVTCDMHKPYRDAAYECIPGVVVVVDKFHVVKMVNDALERIRKSLRKDMGKDERRLLRRSKSLLLSNSEDLDFEKASQLKELFKAYPVFEKPHQIKERFRNIYFSHSKKEAMNKYIAWKEFAIGYLEFEAIANTVDNWHKEIFAYFDYPYTNAVTESLNRLINDMAIKGRRYSFEVLRAKCLYGTKATRREKYDFKKYKKYRDDGLGNTMALFTFAVSTTQSYDVIEKKELASGWSVDIDELDYYIRTEF